jgi:hypothetical protein
MESKTRLRQGIQVAEMFDDGSVAIWPCMVAHQSLRAAEEPMKVYWLTPADGKSWLTPDEVVARLQSHFPRARSDAAAAQERGRRFLGRYRALLASGLGVSNSTPLESVERRWSGALLVEVCADAEGVARFQTVAYIDYRLELEFGRGVPARSRRALANQTARALGYALKAIDGD